MGVPGLPNVPRMALREEWPIHMPEAYDLPIPGRHWYGGCEPGDYDSERGYHGPGPRVNPATCRCEGCGQVACPICGRENCPDHDLLFYRVEQLRDALATVLAPLVRALVRLVGKLRARRRR